MLKIIVNVEKIYQKEKKIVANMKKHQKGK